MLLLSGFTVVKKSAVRMIDMCLLLVWGVTNKYNVTVIFFLFRNMLVFTVS